MEIPVHVPDFENPAESVRVGTWLVEIGQQVEAGDRIVELELAGMVYVVSTEANGRVKAIEQQRGCLVEYGEVLAWLECAEKT